MKQLGQLFSAYWSNLRTRLSTVTYRQTWIQSERHDWTVKRVNPGATPTERKFYLATTPSTWIWKVSESEVVANGAPARLR